ncbi:hypothetical protein HW555_001639 [Spodoptera exigua]|uniref:E3 ubiquitin-protein ligase Hakai n=1 Tax=Spodoptera exigua TaxID=7107 RepID=A0A835GTW5_SPOEX|nr:hypothetical protein HW555_001639 [Spodoptera exigua]
MSSDEEECSVEETTQEQEETVVEEPKEEPEPAEPPKLEVPSDISQLEAPVFTTLQRGPPEPMLRLDWSHRATLIGEKVLNPMIYCCDICSKPILIYGRMIPCKHVFCLSCARAEHTHCPRCREKVLRVEQTGLGTVFMCTHSGTRYGNTGCRRTYLSQRDLQAHINHRHVSSGAVESKPEPEPPTNTVAIVKPLTQLPPTAGDPRGHGGHGHAPSGERPRARTNLITVPIQDQPESHAYYNYYPHLPSTNPLAPSAACAAAIVAAGVVGASTSAHHERAAAHLLRHRATLLRTADLSGNMATNVAVSPMSSTVPMGSVNTIGEGARWGESYQQPSVPVQQWPPQNPHHYYR